MPRPKKTDRPIRVEAKVPESVISCVNLELFSEVEGKVPHGKISELVTQLLRDWLSSRGVQC